MKKLFFLTLALFIGLSTFAQNTKTLQVIDNSKALVQKGIKLADQGKYDEAIKVYSQIPYGDPKYDQAQYEKAYCYELKEDYNTALEILETLANNPSTDVPHVSIYTEMGNCYDYMEQTDKAILMYDKCIQEHPYFYHAYFNKGVALLRVKRYEEAKACFEKSIFLCPAHQGSHFQYGHSCLLLGYTIPGIMAMNYSILIKPASQYGLLALQELDKIYESGIAAYNSDNKISVSSEYKEKNKFYENTSVALNMALMSPKSIKAPTKITQKVAQYNYVVMSNTEVRPNSHEIEDQIYVPFLKSVIAQKNYNTLCYYQFSNTDVMAGKAAKKAEKMSGEFNKLIDNIIDQLNNASEKGIGLAPSDTFYNYAQFDLRSWGVTSKNAKGELQMEGVWHFLTNDGQISSIENQKNGESEGLSQAFRNNRLTEEYTYHNDKLNGPATLYTYNPLTEDRAPRYTVTMKNGNLNGEYKEYNNGGILSAEGFFKDGHPDGEVRTYYPTGQLSAIEQHSDGENKGVQKYYFENGQLSAEYTLGEAGEKLPITHYYPTGKISKEGFIKDNKLVGASTTRFANGSLQETCTLNDNSERTGEYLGYYRNGQLQVKANYIDGKEDGDYIQYDISGRIVLKQVYKNGVLQSVTNYNPDNTERETIPVKNKPVTVDLYDAFGNIFSTITMDTKGQFNGTSKFYHPNGQIRTEIDYKDGEINGVVKQYYLSGRVGLYQEYKNNAQNGLYIRYYDNPAHHVNKESYYRNDTMIRVSYEYYPDGTLQSTSRYDEYGNYTYYSYQLPDGKKVREIFYFNGMPLITNSFDLEGNIVHSDTTLFGNGHNDKYNTHGQCYRSRNLKAGKLDGQCFDYDVNGNIIDTTTYCCDQYNGLTRNLYPTGEVKTSGQFVLDKEVGLFSSYDPMGQLEETRNYELGKLSGENVCYYPWGKIAGKQSYLEDDLEGIVYYYAPDGKTVLVQLQCSKDEYYQYAYLQQNGKMSDWQPIGKDAKTITALYPSGKTAMIINFDKGVFNGSRVVYYPNGQAASSRQYQDGRLYDVNLTYYSNGKVCTRFQMEQDFLNGVYEGFYENGVKAFEGKYFFDTPNGDFIRYDKTGKQIKKATVYYGIPLSME